MSFVAAVEALHGLGQELAPAAPRRKFELAHMRTLARALGDPQTRFPAILVAGTNGKGSTAATLAAILSAAGLRTGLYTSPHLTRVTERIRISHGRPSDQPPTKDCHSERAHRASEESPHLSFAEIPEPDFARLYFRVDEAANRLVATGQLPHHPSFFETLTALAFLFFAESQVDIAVLEVGLGGRLDATNIVEPTLSIITDIALDHQEYLGNTIAEIAREKAGILRLNGVLVTLPQHPQANQAIGEAAIALNVRGVNAAACLPDVVRSTSADPSAGPLSSDNGDRPTDNDHPPLPANHYDLLLHGDLLHVRSPLAGQHQQRNIALAIAAALELRNQKRYNIANSAIEAGIANTQWPGRLEFLPPDLLLDVAHNPAGAWALRAAIATLPQDRPRTLIFSCLRDKDLTEMARILFPLFDSAGAHGPRHHIVFAPIASARATGVDDMLAAAHALDVPAEAAGSVADALALARSLTPAGGLIVATGSVFLVGAIREAAGLLEGTAL
jgi:dihydrofolate synthase/folylpolyglutamate synthase